MARKQDEWFCLFVYTRVLKCECVCMCVCVHMCVCKCICVHTYKKVHWSDWCYKASTRTSHDHAIFNGLFIWNIFIAFSFFFFQQTLFCTLLIGKSILIDFVYWSFEKLSILIFAFFMDKFSVLSKWPSNVAFLLLFKKSISLKHFQKVILFLFVFFNIDRIFRGFKWFP